MNRALSGLASLCLLFTTFACGGDASDGPGDDGGSNVGGSNAGGPDGPGGSGSGGPSDGTGAGFYHCDLQAPDTHVCFIYSDFSSSTGDAIDASCKASGGTRVASCPTSGRLGTCLLASEGLTYGGTYYEGGHITAAQARENCATDGGTWAD